MTDYYTELWDMGVDPQRIARWAPNYEGLYNVIMEECSPGRDGVVVTEQDAKHNGVTFCWCGCKYWTNGWCFDCTEPLERAIRYQDEILGGRS